MPTWKLNPAEDALSAFLKEFIKRRNIDTATRRGQARIRAVTALIEAVATNDPGPLIKHYDALEDGDQEAACALAEDWMASLRRMDNERRPAHHRRKL